MERNWTKTVTQLTELTVLTATHSSILAWRIPGTEEPGGPPSMGSHRVGHSSVTKPMELIS